LVVSGSTGKNDDHSDAGVGFFTAQGGGQFLGWRRGGEFRKSYDWAVREFYFGRRRVRTAFWDQRPEIFPLSPRTPDHYFLEFDHADIYGDFETYELAFRRW